MAGKEQKKEPFEGQAALQELIERVKRAQIKFATYSQEQVDTIFRAAAIAANDARITLAQEAVEETGMGIAVDARGRVYFTQLFYTAAN